MEKMESISGYLDDWENVSFEAVSYTHLDVYKRQMRNWTFEHDNGRNPQTATARFYVESWETMQAENIGYLFWGGVGTGKSYLAACIANALRCV